ncbi:lytic transglycosylase [Sulfurifustis variabilis]|uniref:Lytic transglycosylase n=1 Tax=Sulfurifustis variabilis TaxID=1675686 RepID=A0A1B4V022_9GAMM|nr:lytic murein transglycosylase B [Sulfurifustis variabilis]BAU46759.1 lytic transglycosylase [Sulfurifustis variabilis]
MRLRYLPIGLLALLAASPATATPLLEHPDVPVFIEHMRATHRFDASALERLFARGTMRPEIIAAMERPAEGLPWHEYRRRFVTDRHARLGSRYWRTHAQALARAQREYGVPPEIVVAIIGVETNYGENTGGFPALEALATLAFGYPRRAEFFRRELEEYLLLARELKVDAFEVKGSYAGALGIPQFMPSSYRQYAVDFTGDRKPDLLGSNADAIGSVANFLRRHGWVPGAPIVDEVEVEGDLYEWLGDLGLKPTLTLRQLFGHGIFPRPRPATAAGPDDDRRAAVIVLEGESGPVYRLGYDNFYAISRYNRSKRYAMAVYELGRAIRELYEEGA